MNMWPWFLFVAIVWVGVGVLILRNVDSLPFTFQHDTWYKRIMIVLLWPFVPLFLIWALLAWVAGGSH